MMPDRNTPFAIHCQKKFIANSEQSALTALLKHAATCQNFQETMLFSALMKPHDLCVLL